MEELFAALFEIIGEILINLLAEIGTAAMSKFITTIESDSKLKNRIKMAISLVFFGLSIILLIISIIFGKKYIVIITLCYLLILVILNLFKFINKNIWNKNYVFIFISWIRRIAYYAFPILLIISSSFVLTNENAIICLNICSCIALAIYLIIDIYRLYRFICNRRKKI